jgi:hypothetical protein
VCSGGRKERRQLVEFGDQRQEREINEAIVAEIDSLHSREIFQDLNDRKHLLIPESLVSEKDSLGLGVL